MRRNLAVLAAAAMMLAVSATTSLASAVQVTARTVNLNDRAVGKVNVSVTFYNAQGGVIYSTSSLSDAGGHWVFLGDLSGVATVQLRAGTGPTYSKTLNANGTCDFGNVYCVHCRDCPHVMDGS
jgi:hypothetical protein